MTEISETAWEKASGPAHELAGKITNLLNEHAKNDLEAFIAVAAVCSGVVAGCHDPRTCFNAMFATVAEFAHDMRPGCLD